MGIYRLRERRNPAILLRKMPLMTSIINGIIFIQLTQRIKFIPTQWSLAAYR
jgi:hypothetical protein